MIFATVTGYLVTEFGLCMWSFGCVACLLLVLGIFLLFFGWVIICLCTLSRFYLGFLDPVLSWLLFSCILSPQTLKTAPYNNSHFV